VHRSRAGCLGRGGGEGVADFPGFTGWRARIGASWASFVALVLEDDVREREGKGKGRKG
jgi:hypothetical protein